MNNTISKSVIALYCFFAAIIIILMSTGTMVVQDNLSVFVTIILILATVFAVVNKEEFIIQFTTFQKMDYVILAVMTILLMITSIMWKDTLFGVITTITGIISVIQSSRGSIWTFYWGALNVLFYAMIAYMSNYAGDFVLMAFFNTPMQIVGLYFWANNYKQEQHIVEKKIFKSIDYLYTAIALAIGTVIITYLMPMINNFLFMDSNPLPFVDAFTTTASIIAQVLLTKRYREQWLLWILINVGSIIMWTVKGDPTMVIMWTAYLINAVYGYIKWGE